MGRRRELKMKDVGIEYLEQYNVSKIQKLIEDKDIDELDKYLKKHKNI